MMQQFGVAFDLRNPDKEGTFEEAEAQVRRWAAFQDVAIPDGLEPDIFFHEADGTPGSYPSIHVSFEWDDAS